MQMQRGEEADLASVLKDETGSIIVYTTTQVLNPGARPRPLPPL